MTDIGWRQKCLNYPNIMFGRAVANARSRASKKGLPFVNALKLKMSKESMTDVCRAIVKKADLH
jgi:hypothetical protein